MTGPFLNASGSGSKFPIHFSIDFSGYRFIKSLTEMPGTKPTIHQVDHEHTIFDSRGFFRGKNGNREWYKTTYTINHCKLFPTTSNSIVFFRFLHFITFVNNFFVNNLVIDVVRCFVPDCNQLSHVHQCRFYWSIWVP